MAPQEGCTTNTECGTEHLLLAESPPPYDDESVDARGKEGHLEELQGDDSFVRFFFASKGPPQVVLLCMAVALSLGATVGVIPAVMTDRYARLNHGYAGNDCSTFTNAGFDAKPQECTAGSEDAQNMVALSSFISNGLTFVTSALVGSISDRRGRRGLLLLGMFLALQAPMVLVLVQFMGSMSPTWYYAAHSVTGFVNWFAVAISALSDVMPPKWRAPSFGLLLAGFSLGFAFSPMLALSMSHRGVSVLSLTLLSCSFGFAVAFFPETLPEAARSRPPSFLGDDECASSAMSSRLLRMLFRPMKELSILNRNRLFRLLSALAFFSGMVSSADQSLLVYYAEDQLDFNDGDVALMFAVIGLLGIFIQGFVLKQFNDCIGERRVVIVAFAFGVVSNFLYGIARTKTVLFTGMALSTFVGMSFPTISAIKANNVNEKEQGRIQGALYSLSSLASALGPTTLRVVYHQTRKSGLPGAMFIFASFLYVIATCFAYALPKELADSRCQKQRQCSTTSDDGSSTDSSYGSIETHVIA